MEEKNTIQMFHYIYAPIAFFNLKKKNSKKLKWMLQQQHILQGERVLCALGNGPYLWYKADVDVTEVLPLHLELELSEGLDEGHALNISDCASQLLTENTSFESHLKPDAWAFQSVT